MTKEFYLEPCTRFESEFIFPSSSATSHEYANMQKFVKQNVTWIPRRFKGTYNGILFYQQLNLIAGSSGVVISHAWKFKVPKLIRAKTKATKLRARG